MKNKLFSIILLFAQAAFAGPGITYQGRILKPDGSSMEGTAVQFLMQIRSPGTENCLMYEETQTKNMADSKGIFALTLNDGTGTRTDTPTYTIDRIFSNRSVLTFDSARCISGTTYTPASGDQRKFIVYFKDETMGSYEPMPVMSLNHVPMSMFSIESEKIGAFNSNNLIRAVDAGGNPTTAPALTPTELTEFTSLLNGSSTSYVPAATTAGATVPSYTTASPPSSPAAGSFWFDSTSLYLKYYDGSTVQPVSPWRAATSDIYFNTGKVGVGLSNPAEPLHIHAANYPVTRYTNSTTGTLNSDGFAVGLSGNTGAIVWNRENLPIDIGTNDTDRVRIAADGKVGIGTVTPAQNLHVHSAGATASLARFTNGTTGGLSTDGVAIGYDDSTNGAAIWNRENTQIVFATNDTEKMRLDANGNFGISNTSPGTLLHVGSSSTTAGSAVASFETTTGTCTMTPATSGTGIACSSDERLKKNIEFLPIDFALERLLKIQAVTYEFKKDNSGKRHTGFIAQQLQKIAPEFVRENNDGLLQVYYDGFIPWLIDSIKSLYNKMTGISAQVERLTAEKAIKDKEISALKERIEKIENQLNNQ